MRLHTTWYFSREMGPTGCVPQGGVPWHSVGPGGGDGGASDADLRSYKCV